MLKTVFSEITSVELMCLESKILMGSMCGSIEQNEPMFLLSLFHIRVEIIYLRSVELNPARKQHHGIERQKEGATRC